MAAPNATRLTFEPQQDVAPVWSPSGSEVAFASQRQGNDDIFVKAADGSGEAKALVATPFVEWPTDWSRDGRYLVYLSIDPNNQGDLWYLKRKKDQGGYKKVAFLQTRANASAAQLSPDSRFLAFCSDQSGQNHVYVQQFPEGGGKWEVAQGTAPRWSRDGKGLFNVNEGTLMVVPVKTTPSFSTGSPRQLFRNPNLVWRWPGPRYDVSPDGQRFVVIEEVKDAQEATIRVVQNWFAEFRVVQNWFAEFRDGQGGAR